MSMTDQVMGSREAVNVTFRAKSKMTLGSMTFERGEPVLYFESAKTASMEGGATTVYAQGGRGNPRLIAWEGDKTITFRFEEAVISPRSLSVLTGANLFENTKVPMHKTERITPTVASMALGDATTPADVAVLDLSEILSSGSQVITPADKNMLTANGAFKYPGVGVYVMELDENNAITKRYEVNQNGALTAAPAKATLSVEAESADEETSKFMLVSAFNEGDVTTALEGDLALDMNKTYLVDFYAMAPGATLSISPSKFAGTFQIEADTLFRRQSDGRDLPAQILIPNGKISTSFTLNMAGSGDPSSFPFEVEATPDYTPFNQRCRYLAVINISEEPVDEEEC